MIELAFVACLAGAPADCEEKALQFVEVSLMTCMIGAQPQLAAWQQDHPGWEIRSWNCRHVPTARLI